jgi:hypothetical protein
MQHRQKKRKKDKDADDGSLTRLESSEPSPIMAGGDAMPDLTLVGEWPIWLACQVH